MPRVDRPPLTFRGAIDCFGKSLTNYRTFFSFASQEKKFTLEYFDNCESEFCHRKSGSAVEIVY